MDKYRVETYQVVDRLDLNEILLVVINLSKRLYVDINQMFKWNGF